MTLQTILTELKAERDRLNQAITALEGTARASRATRATSPVERKRRGRGRISAATRRKMSQARREWWAKRKKKKPAA